MLQGYSAALFPYCPSKHFLTGEILRTCTKPYSKMSFKIESDITGTTDPKSPMWDSILYDKQITRLFKTLDIPVYHTERKYYEDMGYDHKGRRAPIVDSIDLYVWTVSNEGLPIVHLYDINPRSKYVFLKTTYTDPTIIKQLSVDYYSDEDDTFSKVYDEISRITCTSKKN